MQKQTCCFTGHRRLPAEKIEQIMLNLEREVENLISQGVTNFISGGALGFDQIAAALIVTKKHMGQNVRLIFALPCKNQDSLWPEKQKKLYHDLLSEADEIIYVGKEYSASCMKERNNYMVEHSAYCICALLREQSGTGQTIRRARKRGVRIVNVAK